MPGDESYDEHEELRARLAAEPAPRMPEDVATRLHEALATESRRRSAAAHEDPAAKPDEPTAPATPLRRPTRWKAPLLAAAAVVAVIAVAVPVVNQVSDDAGGDAASSDGGTTFSGSAAEDQQGQAPDAEAAPQTALDRPELTRADFDTDVRAQLDGADLAREPSTSLRAAVECRDGVPSSAIGRAVTLDGDPAVVLTSRSRGVVPGTEVRAVVCGPDGPEVAARTTLPDRR